MSHFLYKKSGRPRKVSHIKSITGIDSGVTMEESIHDFNVENHNRVILKRNQELSQDCCDFWISFLENDDVVFKSLLKILNKDFWSIWSCRVLSYLWRLFLEISKGLITPIKDVELLRLSLLFVQTRWVCKKLNCKMLIKSLLIKCLV